MRPCFAQLTFSDEEYIRKSILICFLSSRGRVLSWLIRLVAELTEKSKAVEEDPSSSGEGAFLDGCWNATAHMPGKTWSYII